MNYFPDEEINSTWARYGVLVLPLLYLVVALLYSAYSAPWGRQVDPESAYAMNGLASAAGYRFMKNDHPGTTTILLVRTIVKVWAFLEGRSDVIEFGLRSFDAIIYASRAAEAFILSAALLASGIIVMNVTRSVLAGALFQVAPFVHFEVMHFEILLIPESLMVSSAIFGMALVLKAALNDTKPTVHLGTAQGLIFALGLSSKYLHAPLAILVVSLQRNWLAFAAAVLTGAFAFVIFNLTFNPRVFTEGFYWLFSLATHKGTYGEGEVGFIDFNLFWSNMAQIFFAEPIIFILFVIAALVASAQIMTTRRFFDPVGLTLIALFLAFATQVVATSKHFYLHYMVDTWVLTGGVLVLLVIEIRRLIPSVSPRLTASAATLICVILISTTLLQVRNESVKWLALNVTGAKLSRAVVTAGPACANVSGLYVRAPENELNHGADFTLLTQDMEDRFSQAYVRAFDVPLLDHAFYRHVLLKNFHPYSYAKLALEYPCIVVRTSQEVNAKTSAGLLELKPEHCVIENIQVYTVGIACEKIRHIMQTE